MLSQPVRRASKSRGAFTLVELLVVIGIIAILIAILLPSLNKARQQSLALKCASNLRQIGATFKMYEQDYRGYFPVIKYDFGSNGRTGGTPMIVRVGSQVTTVDSEYWWDFLTPYAFKPWIPTWAFANLGTTGPMAAYFDKFRDSVFWGCPSWQGQVTPPAGWGNGGVSVFETGYIFNIFPTYDYNYPSGVGGQVGYGESAFASPAQTVGIWHKGNKWTHPSERCLVTEGLLWLPYINPRVSSNNIQAQPVLAPASRGNLYYNGSGANGSLNVDRYRHGKYPRAVGDFYVNEKKGQKFNILYVDGHVASVDDVGRAFDAIQMKPYP
jgi:prepilin-type N-terminal cleavage/methylation domain-containing protein/prepilin-type processing-associated H-X9-DG protein